MLPDGEQAGKFHVFRIPVLSEPRPRRSDHGPAGPPKVTKTRTVAPRVSEGTGEERRSRGINNLYARLQRCVRTTQGPEVELLPNLTMYHLKQPQNNRCFGPLNNFPRINFHRLPVS